MEMEESKEQIIFDSDLELNQTARTDKNSWTSILRRDQWIWHRKPQLDRWKLATFTFIVISLILLLRLPRHSRDSLGSYEEGFRTDMAFDQNLPLVKRRVHGRLRLFPNFTRYMEPPDTAAAWPENMGYFGNPGFEEDANWAMLMHDTHFQVTEAEAERAWGPDYQKYYLDEAQGYLAELEVFHNLHCLNWVREALSPDVYPNVMDNGHMSHCLDVLRQHIQCYGSSVLIPSQHSEVLGRPYTDTDQMYTCRDFAYLRQWTDARTNEDRARICTDGGESIWGTRCDGYPGPVNAAIWTMPEHPS